MTYLREKGECELAPARGAEGARDTSPGGLSGVLSAPRARGWEELEPGHGGDDQDGQDWGTVAPATGSDLDSLDLNPGSAVC